MMNYPTLIVGNIVTHVDAGFFTHEMCGTMILQTPRK